MRLDAVVWRPGRSGSIVVGFLVAAFALTVDAEPPACPDTEFGRVVVTRDGLQVVEPGAEEVQPDDILVQLNSHRLRTCADLGQALKEARERQLAPLLLVRRDQELEAVLLRQSSAEPGVAAAAPVAVPVTTPTPVAIGPSSVGSVRSTLAELLELGHTLQANLPLLTAQPWARKVSGLREAYERRRTNVPAVAAVEPILAYYQIVAEILLYKEKAVREADHVRPQPNVALNFNTGSQVSTWLHRYPFLQESVVERPGRGIIGGESSGRWSPDRAVELLVQHALADGEALRQRLDAAENG